MELHGIVTPLITPLASPGKLDEAALERLVEHVIDGGVKGIFVLGTTGEGPGLSAQVRREVVARVAGQAAGRVEVMCGITDTSIDESIALACFAADAGANAVVHAGPVYYAVSQPELLRYVEELTSRLPLPLYLYNMPGCTHLSFAAETVAEAAKFPGVAGFKDSSGDMMYFRKVIAALRGNSNFRVFIGPEELLGEAVALGAHGGVNGGSNLFPKLYVKLFEAASRGDSAEVVKLHRMVMAISKGVYTAGTYASSYLKGIKCAAHLLGLTGPAMAWPYEPFGAAETALMRDRVIALEAELRYHNLA
jgi:dihydrodipicolinate synthase/N-acetylneuraminate lyase